MTHVDLDDLADLVLDPDATPDSVREHVESCPDCTDRLAALFDVRRLASGEPLVAPPARVREQVLAQVGGRPEPSEEQAVRPVPLQVASPPDVPRPRHRVPVWAAGLAAGIALVAGLGLGRMTLDDAASPEADAPGAVVAAADLTALDSTAGRGVARAVETDDTITLRVQASELGEDDGFHEVWLINVDGERMVALGVLADGDAGEFQVPRGLLDEGYLIVDISVEPEDGDPTHSGVSLARGELV
jgi:hypothetical protein